MSPRQFHLAQRPVHLSGSRRTIPAATSTPRFRCLPDLQGWKRSPPKLPCDSTGLISCVSQRPNGQATELGEHLGSTDVMQRLADQSSFQRFPRFGRARIFLKSSRRARMFPNSSRRPKTGARTSQGASSVPCFFGFWQSVRRESPDSTRTPRRPQKETHHRGEIHALLLGIGPRETLQQSGNVARKDPLGGHNCQPQNRQPEKEAGHKSGPRWLLQA